MQTRHFIKLNKENLVQWRQSLIHTYLQSDEISLPCSVADSSSTYLHSLGWMR